MSRGVKATWKLAGVVSAPSTSLKMAARPLDSSEVRASTSSSVSGWPRMPLKRFLTYEAEIHFNDCQPRQQDGMVLEETS